MNKNRKIIAFICAISMIFSVFAAFTVTTSAADIEKGIVLEYNKAASTTTKIVINAKYVGAEKINGYTIKLQLPEVYKNVEFTTGIADLKPTEFIDAATKVYGASAALANAVAADKNDNLIGTITINLNEQLSASHTFTLLEESSLVLPEGELYLGDVPEDEKLPAASVKVPKDPNSDEPEVIDPPSVDPEVTLPPTKDKVDVTKGIVLEYNKAASTTTKIVINAKYVGAEKINGYTIKIQLPEVYKDVEFTTGITDLKPTEFIDAATKVYGASAALANAVAADKNDNLIGTITINLNEALKEDAIFELLEESSLVLPEGELYLGDVPEDEKLPAAWIKVPAGESKAHGANLVGDIIKGEVPELSDEAYAVVTATKKDGSEAVYGEDWVAYFNGTKLTKQQLDNLLAGVYNDELGMTLEEILAGITFEYNDGVSIYAQINDKNESGDYENVTDGKTEDDKPSQPTATPTAPTLTLKADNTSVKVGDKVTLTVTKSGNAPDGGTYAVLLKDDSDQDYIGPIRPVKDADNKFTFTALVNGEVTLYATYSYEGAEEPLKTTKDVVVKISPTSGPSKDNSGSDSSSDDSDNKYIFVGNPSGTGAAKFTDLGSVEWAREAIEALAAKGIVAGRSETIFDPNANITRAEYAQILVGAIGLTSMSANSSFADVPTDAWYYHAVSVASYFGIVSGYGDGNFGPNNLITRQDMALMTMKAAQATDKPLTAIRSYAFADADQVSAYAATAVQTLADAGIINGVSETEFGPMLNATRAQAAKILYDTFVK
ncbi:MAG: S-layer homology domain-containing protein [Oscillospiraceae bacterium]|nr:S-layer homology domain-containing protein [Oscillospiraceae bacterium]